MLAAWPSAVANRAATEPMSIDSATVARVAALARIALAPGEAEALVPEFSKILDFVDQLAAVDTEGVDPLATVVPVPLRLRDDVITEGGDREALLANAPQAEHGFFAVPKVIE